MELTYFSFILNLVCFSNGFLLSLQGGNVALNMSATQISTFENWSADRAVDGCTNQSAESDCCSKTLASKDNNWIVDLGTQRTLGKLHIYGLEGGEDELAGFEIWFGTLIKQLLYMNFGKPYTDMMVIYPEPPVQTSMITIRRINDTVEKYLTICEFEAFEVCSEGFYGDTCTSTCGNCLNNETCYGNTGKCEKGCEAGWKGDVCKTVCTDGEYGANCENTCGSCLNNEPCETVTGSCPSGCDPGYTGDKCDTGGNVALNMSATQISTFENWSADRAVDGCTNQSAESDCCSKTLPSNDNKWIVDLGTQRTLGKLHIYGLEGGEDELAGFEIWFGTLIKQLLYMNFGKPYTDMMVIYPEPPVQTSMITIRRINDTVEKYLTICEFEAFEVCSEGFYGDTCTSTCGNCLNNETCYGNTGKCEKGCEAGWKGDVCKTACTDGEYGANCESTCGSCLNNVPCDTVTGICPSGCDPGYTGDKCDTELPSTASQTTIKNTATSNTATSTTPVSGAEGKTDCVWNIQHLLLTTIVPVVLTILQC